jgi:hypothetical protein
MTEARDVRGRWTKGVSGNPKGRPNKYANIDFGDFLRFKNTVLEVDTPLGRKVLTREAAVQERLYASAMKGNVHAQIFLMRQFEKFKETEAELQTRLDTLLDVIRKQEGEPTEEQVKLWRMTRMALGLDRPDFKKKPQRSQATKKIKRPKNPDPQQ